MMRYRAILALLLSLMILLSAPIALADGTEDAPELENTEWVEVRTVEDLMAMTEDPIGHYRLMNDLDLAGVEWTPLDFRGKFDGNGFAIINLTLTKPGEEMGISYDGNEKDYQTRFVGLFGILRNASVTNLKLLNVRACMDVDYPCFLGGIAGYCDNSSITDCTVTGTLELRACKDIYGVGGVAGYGIGRIARCTVDMTLLTVDTDTSTLAEQFLGGAFATGFIDTEDNHITIDGYVSEFGYVHSGGICGLYVQQPLGRGVSGRQTGNTVLGKITFFEKNKDRRAYCAAFAGETLALTYVRGNNDQDFKRQEIWNDTTELRPCSCAHPTYNEEKVEPTCNTFGYTAYECVGCGYIHRDNYTHRVHNVSAWSVLEPATVEAEGISVGYCDDCGEENRRMEPKLDPPPTTEATEPPATEPVVVEKKPVKLNWQVPVMVLGFGFLFAAAWLLGKDGRKKKK